MGPELERCPCGPCFGRVLLPRRSLRSVTSLRNPPSRQSFLSRASALGRSGNKCTESAVLSSAEALVNPDEVGTGRHAVSRHRAPEWGQCMRSLCAMKCARFPHPSAVPVGLLPAERAVPGFGRNAIAMERGFGGEGTLPPPCRCPTHIPGTARPQEWTHFSNSKASTAKVTFESFCMRVIFLYAYAAERSDRERSGQACLQESRAALGC